MVDLPRFFYSTFFVFLVSLVGIASGFSCGDKNAEMASAPSHATGAESKPLRAQSSPEAKVFFVNLRNGDKVTSPFKVVFGAKGIEIAPAGEVKDNSGHHHLLIDIERLPAYDQPLPATDQILHFGQAQTEATITPPPGPHYLQLLLAGGNHVPNNPPVKSEKIRIIVVEKKKD